MSGAFDKSVFDGNTVLLTMSEEFGRHRYVNIGGDMIGSYLTNDNIYKYISSLGNNLTPCSTAIGEENIYVLTPYFIFIKSEKTNDIELLKANKSSVDPFYYHVSKCGKNLCIKIRIYKFHSNYD